MSSIKIKLNFEGDGIRETTTFMWFNDTLEFYSSEILDLETNEIKEVQFHDSHYLTEEDFLMIENYIQICGSKLLKAAEASESTICFKKEIWLDYHPAIVESWLEKDGCSMLRTSTRVDYCNNILPLLSENSSLDFN